MPSLTIHEIVDQFLKIICSNRSNRSTQSLKFFPRNLREDFFFFLKIGILSPKVYSKNVPNIEA